MVIGEPTRPWLRCHDGEVQIRLPGVRAATGWNRISAVDLRQSQFATDGRHNEQLGRCIPYGTGKVWHSAVPAVLDRICRMDEGHMITVWAR